MRHKALFGVDDGARTQLCQKPLETRTSTHFRFFQQVENRGKVDDLSG